MVYFDFKVMLLVCFLVIFITTIFTRRCPLDGDDDNDNMFRRVNDDAYDDNDDDDMFRRVGAQL